MSDGKGFLDQFNKPEPVEVPVNTVDPKDNPIDNPIDDSKEDPQNEPTPTPDDEPINDPSPKDDPKEDPKDVDEPKDDPTPLEINDDAVVEYLKSQGHEVESLDGLFKKEDPIDPFEGISPELKQLIEFSKETNGRPIEDWLALNKDFDKMSPLDLARERAKEATKGKLSSDDIDLYLEKKLKIDLSDTDELDRFDALELETYGSEWKDKMNSQKEKFRKPLEPSNDGKDFITLDNGMQVEKSVYDKFEQERQVMQKSIQDSVDNIADFGLKVKIDDNGVDSEYDLNYEYSKEDKHKMVSLSADLNQAVNSIFDSKEGFDAKGYAESVPWLDPKYREKKITALIHKALAQRTEDIFADEHNAKFDQKRMPENKNKGKTIPLPGTGNPWGVKHKF